jgi:hypothetical protein
MAATPYKIAMSLKNSDGAINQITLTASDVAAAFWLFPSGGSEMQLSSKDCWITDTLCTSAGVDTTQAQIYINGVDTGRRVFSAANLGTQYSRQIQSCPIFVPAGALVRFTQVA